MNKVKVLKSGKPLMCLKTTPERRQRKQNPFQAGAKRTKMGKSAVFLPPKIESLFPSSARFLLFGEKEESEPFL